MVKFKLLKVMAVASLCASAILVQATFHAHADSREGDIYLTLGEDLTLKEKDIVYKNLNLEGTVPEDSIVYVTNEEEHKYLASYISKQKIGSTSLSSSKIELGAKGSGLVVSIDENITYITDAMYLNALATSGVTDVNVMVTAPYKVSGTAALTGILKTYEKTTGEKIPEEQKQVANEEMITTAKLSEDIGDEKASEIITAIKSEISEEKEAADLTDEALSTMIDIVAEQHGVTLSEENKKALIDLMNSFKELDIDWSGVVATVDTAKEKMREQMKDLAETTPEEKEKVEGFFAFITDLLVNITEFFGGLFS